MRTSVSSRRGSLAIHYPEEQKTLLWVDTILCDAETNHRIVETYLERFRLTLASIGNQIIPNDVDIQLVIHLSRDKVKYRPIIEESINQMDPQVREGARVHVYDHPSEGYGTVSTSHVDKLKNPNKQPGRREALFRSAVSEVNLNDYTALIRISMDDDDIFHPSHFLQISRISRIILQDAPDRVSALGLYRQHLATLTGDGVTLLNVDFNRCIPGNKFFVIPASHFLSVHDYSPWGIPELIDEEAADRFRLRDINLTLVRNNEPTFVYMRRNSNLSRTNKSDFIDHIHGEKHFATEEALVSHFSSASSAVTVLPDIRPLPRQFQMTASRGKDGRVSVTTNFSKLFQPGSTIAFYLMRGAEKLETIWYSQNRTVTFKDVPHGCSVRAFVRSNGEIIQRKSIRIWD